MTAQEQSSLGQTWRDAIDPRLLQRLLQRATLPGVIGTQLAATVLSRFHNANRSSLLLAELLRRYGGDDFFRGEHVPVVYAQPPQGGEPGDVNHVAVTIRGEHVPVVYAQPPQVGEPGDVNRVAVPVSAAPRRVVQPTATSPVQSALTQVVHETERTERPIIVGTFISVAQQERGERERQEQPATSAALEQTQLTPVVSSQRRQRGADERREASATVVQPTKIVREGFAHVPVVAPRETLQVIQTLTPTSDRQPVASPSVHGETGAVAPQQRPESGARLSTTLREVSRSRVFHADDRAPAEFKLLTPQRPVVTATSQSSPPAPPTLTLARAAAHSPISGGAARPASQSEPHVRTLDSSSRSRVTSHSGETSVRSRGISVSPTSEPTVKESSSGVHSGLTPARELRELAEKVQQKLDIDALAEKVQRQLRRRLLVEHERRGRTRWT